MSSNVFIGLLKTLVMEFFGLHTRFMISEMHFGRAVQTLVMKIFFAHSFMMSEMRFRFGLDRAFQTLGVFRDGTACRSASSVYRNHARACVEVITAQ